MRELQSITALWQPAGQVKAKSRQHMKNEALGTLSFQNYTEQIVCPFCSVHRMAEIGRDFKRLST